MSTGDQSAIVQPEVPDPQIMITLPFSAWCIVEQHLQVGSFNVVAGLISAISHQAAPQIEAAHQAARIRAAELASVNPAEARTH